jgi:acyl carrier protein
LSELRSYLAAQLPEYMVPAAFIPITMPLTASGKINRRALPAPTTTLTLTAAEFVAPRNALEELLAALWAELLGLEKVSVQDDFFQLGGHSLLATRLVSRIREMFQVELPLRSLFDHSTVAGLAEALLEDPSRRGQVEQMAALLVELNQLSDAELEARLVGRSLQEEVIG